jgi:fermentation-respiration switch protein FrsA (DUF1100 family)
MMTSLRRRLRTAALTLAIGYLGVVGVLMYLENRLVYHPVPASAHWIAPSSDEVQELELTSADGNRIGAWWLPCTQAERTLLYFHGNAGNLSDRGDSILKVRKYLDTAVLIVDYPGYGKSTGSPSEQGCYQAADAGYDYLVNNLNRDPKHLLLFGGSLGGSVALDLAIRRPHQAVILVKSFTSVPDVGGRHYPWIPVHWLMRNQFRSIDKIAKLHTPVFITHGDKDRVIPFDHSEALFRAANEPKSFLRLAGHGHDESLPREFFDEVRKFLGDPPIRWENP